MTRFLGIYGRRGKKCGDFTLSCKQKKEESPVGLSPPQYSDFMLISANIRPLPWQPRDRRP